MKALLVILSASIASISGAMIGISESGATLELLVESNLLVDPRVNARAIEVQVSNGVATLTGQVANLAARRAASLVAAGTRGVEDVRNRLTVAKSGRGDQAIQWDIMRAIRENPAADLYQILVRVQDGRARLSGIVDSYTEKKLAESAASSVYGVLGVQNDIDVVVPEVRSDYEIQTDIEGRLRADRRLGARRINVSVAGGRVTLSGTVDRALEKYWARSLGMVAGARSVDTTGLRVTARSNQPRSSRVSQRIARRDVPVVEQSEEQMHAAVRRALLVEPVFQEHMPQVRVENARVTLTGTVPTMYARQRAATIARGILGVRQVRNNLRVESRARLAKEMLADRVKRALDRDAYLHDDDLGVRVIRENTVLAGRVDSEFERQRAEQVASGVFGVSNISNGVIADDF